MWKEIVNLEFCALQIYHSEIKEKLKDKEFIASRPILKERLKKTLNRKKMIKSGISEH